MPGAPRRHCCPQRPRAGHLAVEVVPERKLEDREGQTRVWIQSGRRIELDPPQLVLLRRQTDVVCSRELGERGPEIGELGAHDRMVGLQDGDGTRRMRGDDHAVLPLPGRVGSSGAGSAEPSFGLSRTSGTYDVVMAGASRPRSRACRPRPSRRRRRSRSPTRARRVSEPFKATAGTATTAQIALELVPITTGVEAQAKGKPRVCGASL